jgi:pectinesterase
MPSSIYPKPDIVVAANGSGDFTTVQAAVDSIPADNAKRKIILIKRGVYTARIKIATNDITLLGEDRRATRLEYAIRREDYERNRDNIGRAVVNIEASGVSIRNLTIENTQDKIGSQGFTIHGATLNRLIIRDCDLISIGANTISPQNGACGMYYIKNCLIKGAVDFVRVYGWCHMEDCSLFEVIQHASIWHDGSKDPDQKLVLRNCKFDGVKDFLLGRRHKDAQFYLVNCAFSENMHDECIFRQTYPFQPFKNAPNLLLDRAYYFNCHRKAGDYHWHKDNLATAPGSPKVEDITPAWTFSGKWDPLSPMSS